MKTNGLQRLLAVSACVLASTASLCFAQATSLSAGLRGTNEVPPNASVNTGSTSVTVDPTTGLVTWNTTSTIPVTSATGHHIHRGVAGVNGPVVINFNAAYAGAVVVTPVLAAEVIANPAGFYVNLHTAAFPGGEVRGQLAALPPPAATVPTLTPSMMLVLALGLSALGAAVFRRSKRA